MADAASLQPFRIFASARRRVGALYAYAETAAAALRQVASLAATPDCLAVLDPGELRTKLMPEGFVSDQRLGFDVRVRPVRRSQRDCRDAQPGADGAKGAEVDAAEFDARPDMQLLSIAATAAAPGRTGAARRRAGGLRPSGVASRATSLFGAPRGRHQQTPTGGSETPARPSSGPCRLAPACAALNRFRRA